MTLSNLDRDILQKCLAKDPQAWAELTDRFLGLIIHVAQQTAFNRNIELTPESRDDLVAEVFLSWIEKDFDVLRRFQGNSSLATYLTVIARRVVVRRLSQLRLPHSNSPSIGADRFENIPSRQENLEEPFFSTEDRESLEQAIERLSQGEARAVRMFHFEGKSYQDIAQILGMAPNSVGPFLSKARQKIRSHSGEA